MAPGHEDTPCWGDIVVSSLHSTARLSARPPPGLPAEDDLLAALRKEREAAARELALIADGIKYARCGVDDVGAAEAVETGDVEALSAYCFCPR